LDQAKMTRRRKIALGFAARDVAGASGGRVRLRETAARAAAWFDVSVLGRGPRFLGPSVGVGRRSTAF